MTTAEHNQPIDRRLGRNYSWLSSQLPWWVSWHGIAILWVIMWGGHLIWCLIPGLERWLGFAVFVLGCMGAGMVFSALWQRHYLSWRQASFGRRLAKCWPLVVGLAAWIASGWSLVWFLALHLASVR
jgi:hypothetical protein